MIKFSHPLIKATLVKRYKRFLADIILENGEEVTCHCPNTGSMKSCGAQGDTIYVLPSSDPKRKLKYTWEYTQTKGGFIGINTQRPNRIVEDAIVNNIIPELQGYSTIKREQKYGNNSKIDLLLEAKGKTSCYVEIKNVTLLEDNTLLFPDAITVRGQKHLKELISIKERGYRAVMFYLINRPDGKNFRPAEEIDPEYAKLFEKAKDAGVEIFEYRAKSTLSGMSIALDKLM